MAARPPVAKPLLPPGERFRSAIEEAKEGGIAPSAMLLQLTHTDAAKLRRDQSIPVHDISFADGAMRYLGVTVAVGAVSSSALVGWPPAE